MCQMPSMNLELSATPVHVFALTGCALCLFNQWNFTEKPNSLVTFFLLDSSGTSLLNLVSWRRNPAWTWAESRIRSRIQLGRRFPLNVPTGKVGSKCGKTLNHSHFQNKAYHRKLFLWVILYYSFFLNWHAQIEKWIKNCKLAVTSVKNLTFGGATPSTSLPCLTVSCKICLLQELSDSGSLVD